MQVAEQTAVAKREVEQAAASVAGLAFEDKLRLITALQPEPLAALVGVCHGMLLSGHSTSALGCLEAMRVTSSIAACQAKPDLNLRANHCCSNLQEHVQGERSISYEREMSDKPAGRSHVASGLPHRLALLACRRAVQAGGCYSAVPCATDPPGAGAQLHGPVAAGGTQRGRGQPCSQRPPAQELIQIVRLQSYACQKSLWILLPVLFILGMVVSPQPLPRGQCPPVWPCGGAK